MSDASIEHSEGAEEARANEGGDQGARGISVSASLVAFVILVAFGLRAEGVLTADTWFNLRFGQRVVREGLPRVNDDVLLAMGAPWVDLQWLAHAIWYGVYAAFGVVGVVLVRASLMTYVLTSVHWRDTRRTLRPALIVMLASIVAIPFGAARAQSFAEFLFVITVGILDREPSWPRRALILGITVLWANLHGSAPLVPALIVWRALVRGRAWKRSDVLYELALAALCGAALFVSPYGLHALSHYRGTLANPLLRARVVEWSAATLSLTPWYFAVVAVMVAAAVRGRAWRRDPFGVGLGAAFMLLGFWSVRHQIWFAVVVARFGAGWIDDALGEGLLRFRVRGDRWAKPLPYVGALCVVAGALYARRAFASDGFTEVTRVLAAASERGERLYVDLAHVDRALLVEHRLRGKLQYDIRFELWKAEDFSAHSAREKGRSERAMARWEQYDVLFLERPEEFGPVIQALIRTGRWRTLRVGPTGTLLRRAALGPDASRAWSAFLGVQREEGLWYEGWESRRGNHPVIVIARSPRTG